MRRGFVTIAVLLACVAPVAAQVYAPESLDRYFRLEWQVSRGNAKGPVIDGYVYNRGAQNAERMSLVIERLDDAGRVAGSSTVWVLGGVPMGNRGYFRARVADAASYRVRVLSFDWTSRGGM